MVYDGKQTSYGGNMVVQKVAHTIGMLRQKELLQSHGVVATALSTYDTEQHAECRDVMDWYLLTKVAPRSKSETLQMTGVTK